MFVTVLVTGPQPGSHGPICMTSNSSSNSLPGVMHAMVNSPVGGMGPGLPVRPPRFF